MPMTRIPASTVPPGAVKAVDHGGGSVALCNVGGTFYAIQDRCPHRMASLSDGRLDGATIVCPKHRGQFDLQTGDPLVWVAEPPLLHFLAKLIPKRRRRAKVYPTRRDGADVVIGD